MENREELLHRAFYRMEEWVAADNCAKTGDSTELVSVDSSAEVVGPVVHHPAGSTSAWSARSELSEEACNGLRRAYKRLDRLLAESAIRKALAVRAQQSQEEPGEEPDKENI